MQLPVIGAVASRAHSVEYMRVGPRRKHTGILPQVLELGLGIVHGITLSGYFCHEI